MTATPNAALKTAIRAYVAQVILLGAPVAKTEAQVRALLPVRLRPAPRRRLKFAKGSSAK